METRRVALEAQQRYFSYRAILVAIVSQSYLVLVFVGVIAQISDDTLWGIAQMCLCETKYPGEGIAPPWELLTSLKENRAIWGVAAVASQYRAIWVGATKGV